MNVGMSTGAVRVGDYVLLPGEAAPLAAGLALRLGAREFEIKVE